ncbi:hypothetical protein [Anabaena azotica]|uniref:SPOR domain-containing protein n=1 Tax=Anabaena azotica FACHB-119 TaxID=947527 RepID=A0ABR8CYF6_9NOST|nr:hypothetical protein [Anabaena azotica]MBD2499198.1 hypothetical protein [Anabaena azotica FACHB-119]
MSQKPLMDGNGLKPALAAALASLEVQLEQELARYRRKRMGIRATSQSSVHSYAHNYAQESADKNATMANTQPSLLEIKPLSKPLPLSPTPQEKPAPVTIKSSTQDKKPQPEIENISPPVPSTQTPDPRPQTPDPRPQTPVPKIPDNSQPEANTQIPLPPAKSKDNGSIVPAIAQPNQSDKLLADDTPPQPDDYLESSEALLRSLTDEQPEENQARNANDSLLSPLGIGSMLLLLVASLTLGYVVFNPKTLPQLNFSRLFNGNSSPSTENPQPVASNPQTQLQPELTPIPKYPNLAAKEFSEVRDPIDVVGLQPKVQPTPTTPANPIAIQTPVVPPVTNTLPETQPLPTLNPSPSPSLQPIPTATLNPSPSPSLQPIPTATATPTPPSAEIKPSADGRYSIVIENQNSNTLNEARRVVPDAYLSRNSKLIYLATVKTKQQAQQRLKKLQAQGLKVTVQQP